MEYAVLMSEITKPGDLRRSHAAVSDRTKPGRFRSVIEPAGQPLAVPGGQLRDQRPVKTLEGESRRILERDQRKLTTTQLLQLARKTKKKSLTEPKKRRR